MRAALTGPEGLIEGLRFEPEELTELRAAVEAQWLARIERLAADQVDNFREAGIERYHELCHVLSHATAWPKRERVLPPSAVETVRNTSLFRRLDRELGPMSISGEDGVEREEVYWRLVRPGEPGDIGPLHADAWFWELGHGVTPVGMKRVKIWIAIACAPGKNGLLVVPGSHRRDWRYSGVARDGKVKPQIDTEQAIPEPVLAATPPGTAVVFHDRLLHGGAPNHGTQTRVSLEFTMFVPS